MSCGRMMATVPAAAALVAGPVMKAPAAPAPTAPAAVAVAVAVAVVATVLCVAIKPLTFILRIRNQKRRRVGAVAVVARVAAAHGRMDR